MRIVKSGKPIKASNETGDSDIPTYKLAWTLVHLNDDEWEAAGASCEEEFQALKKKAREILRKTEGMPVKLSKNIKASKRFSANEQALKHIKAAIDILGKSGDKSDITKDNIANLATIMFDLQDNK